MTINILRKIAPLYFILLILLKEKHNINFHLKNNIYNKALLYMNRGNYNKSLNSIKKLKKVVYSALLGKYDILRPFSLQKGFYFFLFTDISNINHNETNWTILPLPKELNDLNLSRIKKQRYLKLHPHLYFQNYDLSIYIDSSFNINGDLNEFLLRILTPKYNIYNFEHPSRNSIFKETFAVVQSKKENESIAKFIRERYIKEKFPDNNGLIEGCLIVRRHNKKDCIYLMNKWFSEIAKYSRRDQLSFNYILWKTKIKIKYISQRFSFNYFVRYRYKEKFKINHIENRR